VIFKECFSGPPWFEHWTVEKAEAFLRSVCRRNFFLAIRKALDERSFPAVASFALGIPISEYVDHQALLDLGVAPQSFYIMEVATATRFQRKGYALAACTALVELAKREKFHSASLRTRPDNTSAIKLFTEHMDFRKMGSYDATTGEVCSPRIVFELKF
jgi:ribosomal protein S18 acetylase RimI-like enzyme